MLITPRVTREPEIVPEDPPLFRPSVVVGDQQVSTCEAGDFIGEIGFFSRAPATATVSASGPFEVMVFNTNEMRRKMEKSVEFERGLTVGLNSNLAAKLIRSNNVGANV